MKHKITLFILSVIASAFIYTNNISASPLGSITVDYEAIAKVQQEMLETLTPEQILAVQQIALETHIRNTNTLNQIIATNQQNAPAKAQEIFNIINNYRIQNGLNPLAWNDTCATAANIRANELITCYNKDHIRPDGRKASSVITDIRNDFSHPYLFGENAAFYTRICTAEEAFLLWKNSPKHNAIMLYPDFTSAAVGVSYGPDGTSYYSFDAWNYE